MALDERRVGEIVERIVREMAAGVPNAPSAAPAAASAWPAAPAGAGAASGQYGIHAGPEEAIVAAEAAFATLREGGRALRAKVIEVIRTVSIQRAAEWGRMAREDTGMGRASDKKIKNESVAKGTPGVEDLESSVMRGDDGLHVIEGGPWGVICSITPSTNPTATVINNGIAMIAAGNTIVFCPHPSAINCTLTVIRELNEAIVAAGGPRDLMTCVAQPDLRAASAIMKHERIRVIAATGGPGVVRAAFDARKKVFAAGPGNPPVLVDATADIARAGWATVAGGSFDNNLPCVAEKIGICEQRVLSDYLAALSANGAMVLSNSEAERVLSVVLDGDAIRKESIGQDAGELLRRAGLSVPADEPRLLVASLPQAHPVVQHEQLMPFLPVVSVRDFDHGLAVTLQVEHAFLHTAMLHSRDTEHITRFAEATGTTITVINGPSYAFSGDSGEGYATMTVTTPTGEGVSSPRTWVRRRHLVYSGMLGLVRS